MATKKAVKRSTDELTTALVLLSQIFQTLDDEQADNIMVDTIYDAMMDKLTNKRIDGRGGWYSLSECSNEKLLAMLRQHLTKGDMIDVINLAAMIHMRTIIHGKDA